MFLVPLNPTGSTVDRLRFNWGVSYTKAQSPYHIIFYCIVSYYCIVLLTCYVMQYYIMI